MADPSKVTVKLHKLIYKYLEDIDNFVHDANKEIQLEQGQGMEVHVLGSAKVAQLFKAKGVRSHPNKHTQVAGSKVQNGSIQRKHRFRVVRDEIVLADNLKLSSLKKFSNDV